MKKRTTGIGPEKYKRDQYTGESRPFLTGVPSPKKNLKKIFQGGGQEKIEEGGNLMFSTFIYIVTALQKGTGEREKKTS